MESFNVRALKVFDRSLKTFGVLFLAQLSYAVSSEMLVVSNEVKNFNGRAYQSRLWVGTIKVVSKALIFCRSWKLAAARICFEKTTSLIAYRLSTPYQPPFCCGRW